MTEEWTSDELVVGQRISALAHAGVSTRDPNEVAQAVVRGSRRAGLLRLSMPLVATTGLLVLLAVVAVASFGQVASSPGRAVVGGITIAGINLGGTTYDISVARSLDLSGARLTAVGEAHHYTGGFRTEGSTVYQVDDVDPQQVLLMKLEPGEHDDAGSVGQYLVLVRSNGFALLCPYFADGDRLAPADCR